MSVEFGILCATATYLLCTPSADGEEPTCLVEYPVALEGTTFCYLLITSHPLTSHVNVVCIVEHGESHTIPVEYDGTLAWKV